MGIFGTKKQASAPSEDGDFADSPVEQVQLNAPPPAPAKAAAVVDEARPAYGIDDAIKLMRSLPQLGEGNVELIVQVIKTTLESLRVRVGDIVEDANRRQKDLEGRIANLKAQISEFEREIIQRTEEIGKLEGQHKETTTVKGRLELAEKLSAKG
jgi:hypothetical protein